LAIFYYLRPDRSTDIAFGRFSLFIRPAVLSHARTQEISTADPRRNCLLFLLSISIFFPSSTDKCCCCWCDFVLCVRIVLSLAHALTIGLLFSPAGHATRMYEQSHGSLAWVCVMCVLNYGRGKLLTPAHFRLANIFSLSLSLPILILLLHFLSPSCE
jgi:hypothetical protein